MLAATIVPAMPHVLFPTPFGTCGIAWNDTGLTGFQLPEETAALTEQHLARKARSQPATEPPPEWVQGLIGRVQQHLEGQLQDFAGTELDWSRVTDFQQAVYLQAQAIKPGYKKSYGEIAKLMALGHEAARAVGVALATNPWPLIVPCHRVVSAGDKMTGFSAPGGVRTKTRLLTLEGAELLSE
ncbi:methylated-DNA-[protein]-cysteine S-methyltransferase [Opitutus sp. GAS368]|jgi:methylated-DNA-[protein]-cysteine S-methyltransferase|nr:methylated-DNA-[protein]-cysteine S-methyltransferase [Opitutus sp. GAS368]